MYDCKLVIGKLLVWLSHAAR